MGDVLHVLKHGFVYDPAEVTRDGLFAYKMQCRTPNSGAREIGIVVIPSEGNELRIVIVMWVDN